MEFRKQRNIFCTGKALLCFTQKNNVCIINEIKLVWFYSLYRNYLFEWKCDIFMYFKNIFYHLTLKNIFKILNDSVYFQNIVVCNEPFRKRCSENVEQIDRSPCQSMVSVNLQGNFTEITLWHRFSLVNLQHIFRAPFTKVTSEGLWYLLVNFPGDIYLLTLNRFHKYLWCFHCWLRKSKCRLGRSKNAYNVGWLARNTVTQGLATKFKSLILYRILLAL